jgi:hypothetical protein
MFKKYQIILFFVPILLGFIVFLCGFNGLYGQDCHEYLRQSEVIYQRLLGAAAPAATLGDDGFPSGFPLLGAFLRFFLRNSILALAAVTWISAGFCLVLFDLNLQKLSTGSALKSRLLAIITLGFAPVFFSSSFVCMADISALMSVLAMFFFGQNVLQNNKNAVITAIFGAFALLMRFAMAGLVVPFAMMLTWHLWKQKKYGIWLTALLVGGLVLSLHFWLKINAAWFPAHHGIMQDWSFLNLFKRNFQSIDGSMSYFLPNGLLVLSVLMHPGFCLLLCGLFFLFKKTDLHLLDKKILLCCLICYLLLIGGTTAQAHRFLLPAYSIVLLLLFPAFDRFISYGFTYFKTPTLCGLALMYALQICFCFRYFKPLLERNQEEQKMATILSKHLGSGQILYGFDWDIALKTYLPALQHRNLWVKQYDNFESGTYVIFNKSALEKQWTGKNPMLNWQKMNEMQRLDSIDLLPKGWVLYQIRGRLHTD